jgi:hypothetical protein
MKREHLWPLALTLVLAITVAANIWVMRNPSFAIEPDYYARAVRWDSTMAQERRNGALAWHVAPVLADFTREGATLDVSITDASGHPVRGARVRVFALYVGRAGEVVDTALVERGNRYAVVLPVRHAGAWELRFEVERDGDRFTATHRVDAHPATRRGS